MRNVTAVIRAGVTAVSLACSASLAAADVVISQFSGGYIELFNRGAGPVNLTGLSLHLRGSFIPEWSKVADLTATIPAGGYYLIRSAPGGGDPAADLIVPGGLASTNGSLVLANWPNQFTCGSEQFEFVADRVGYGAFWQCPEGTEVASLGAGQAGIRNGSGCTDTDNNAADFSLGARAPRNSASPPHICGVTGVPPVEATSVRLAPPSPNPSSRLTEFAFTVSRDGLVRLEVFDLKGRRVSTIVNGWRPSGAAHASWDGLRDDGTIAAAGVYFVRLSDSGAPGESRPFLRSR